MNNFTPTYKWNLTDLKKVEKNGLKVFSCFACGGGSTMGYKLAGFDVIGANDIDPEMAWHYKTNHNPKHYFLEDIRKFSKREDLPKELYSLDILDGSPPCSSFSMAGARQKGWGKKKVFREGQTSQVLDDLFFDFIELARRLQPKVVVAENVKGLIQGNAKGYVKQIINLFNVAGYNVQLFLLNAATMGVPQKRERVFFVCSRKDLELPKLKMGFCQKPIVAAEIIDDNDKSETITADQKKWWRLAKPGDAFSKNHPKGHWFNAFKINRKLPINTIAAAAGNAGCYHDVYPRKLNTREYSLAGSYPLDYVFHVKMKPVYIIGMSVPPLMTYGVANQIYQQWLNNDKALAKS
jgi:DNA (cytosine-5)-methyltransferase 1